MNLKYYDADISLANLPFNFATSNPEYRKKILL